MRDARGLTHWGTETRGRARLHFGRERLGLEPCGSHFSPQSGDRCIGARLVDLNRSVHALECVPQVADIASCAGKVQRHRLFLHGLGTLGRRFTEVARGLYVCHGLLELDH